MATLALRAMIPLGYMPGNILNGEFMVLCPIVSATAIKLLPAASTHQHKHGDAAETVPSIGAACPIGSSLFFDAIPIQEYVGQINKQIFFAAPLPAHEWYRPSPQRPQLARAPPQS